MKGKVNFHYNCCVVVVVGGFIPLFIKLYNFFESCCLQKIHCGYYTAGRRYEFYKLGRKDCMASQESVCEEG